MRNNDFRPPKNYDGTALTSRRVTELLPNFLAKISSSYEERPDIVLAAWPDIIGSKLAPMTQAISVVEGVLTVKVKNSTLHSLLSRHDKFRILAIIQKRFPKAGIQNIVFRIG